MLTFARRKTGKKGRKRCWKPAPAVAEEEKIAAARSRAAIQEASDSILACTSVGGLHCWTTEPGDGAVTQPWVASG